MTYNMFGGTLNPTLLLSSLLSMFCFLLLYFAVQYINYHVLMSVYAFIVSADDNVMVLLCSFRQNLHEQKT